MRLVYTLFLLSLGAGASPAQESPPAGSALKSHANLVLVPVFASTRDGQMALGLAAGDFLLTDNGVPQRISLEQDTDSQPLALAVVVETGGAGARHLADYRELDGILDALVGGVEHRVAVVGFDRTPHLLVPFTAKLEEVSAGLANLAAGDHGAAILDAVAFAVAQLRSQPPNHRRAILLLSETIDQGSETTLGDALRLISDTNTAIYSFGFSSVRSAVGHEASKVASGEPGPPHGCFSREGADPEYDGHYSKQVLDCISQLAPPLRLATMAFLTARNSLRSNTAESLAQLTGGEFFRFHNARDLKAGLFQVSNNIPNYYVLAFQPIRPTIGPHALHVTMKERGKFTVRFRREYWIEERSR